MTLYEALKLANPNNYVIIAWLDGEIEEKAYHLLYYREDLHNRMVEKIFIDNGILGFYISKEEI